jgi:hypothetical protein
MPPKTDSKMFRKGKGKGKAKPNQGINIKINIGQPKRTKARTASRRPSANPPKTGARPAFGKALPAFSAAPQGFAGGGVQGPAVVVQPMPQPVQQPDTTTSALVAYNQLLLQNQAQQNSWRNRGGLNIQPNFGDFRASSQETGLMNPYQVPSNYYSRGAGIVEEVIDDELYDDPMVNDVIDSKLDYAPQLPDLTESASSSGMILTEKQDNALSNLVSREQMNQRDKQVQNDLDNVGEEGSAEDVVKDIEKVIKEVDKAPYKPTISKTNLKKLAEQDKPFFDEVNQEVANLQNNAGKWFGTAKGTKLMYITEVPEGKVYNLTSGRWISDKSPIYLNAVKTGLGDSFTTDLGKIHRVRKLG